MRLYRRLLPTLKIFVFVCTCASAIAQSQDTVHKPVLISAKYIDQVSHKTQKIEQNLDKQTIRVLQKFKRHEARIKRKVANKDSLKAELLSGNIDERYKKIEGKLQQPSSLQEYLPALDSMNSVLKFLQNNPQFLSGPNESSEKLRNAISKANSLKDRFQNAEEVKRFLQERKATLKNELQNLGLTKELKRLNKEFFYYGEYLKEYKTLLKDHKKAERKALELLSQSKWFQEFMQKNSLLGQFFSLPNNYNSPQSLTGLQTRGQVQQLVAQQIGTASVNGVDPRQYVQQQMQLAQQQLDQLKEKIKMLDLDGGNGNIEMPDFKINRLRTKSFLKRIEFGFDLQNQRSRGILPLTSDFALSIGYKIRNGMIAGLGSSYKMGWGSGFRHLKITNQGVGLRSFMEVKLKGSVWISSGFEYNYMKEFKKLADIANPDIWQQSALLGISKKYRLSKNKQGTIQLLYDFLAKKQLPQGQVLKLRLGYRF